MISLINPQWLARKENFEKTGWSTVCSKKHGAGNSIWVIAACWHQLRSGEIALIILSYRVTEYKNTRHKQVRHCLLNMYKQAAISVSKLCNYKSAHLPMLGRPATNPFNIESSLRTKLCKPSCSKHPPLIPLQTAAFRTRTTTSRYWVWMFTCFTNFLSTFSFFEEFGPKFVRVEVRVCSIVFWLAIGWMETLDSTI